MILLILNRIIGLSGSLLRKPFNAILRDKLIIIQKDFEDEMIDSNWKELAYAAVRQVAENQPEFTPDDIWATGLQKPIEARALGGVMQRAKKDGIAEKTGRSQPTTQRESHGADVTVWRSLIYVAPSE